MGLPPLEPAAVVKLAQVTQPLAVTILAVRENWVIQDAPGAAGMQLKIVRLAKP